MIESVITIALALARSVWRSPKVAARATLRLRLTCIPNVTIATTDATIARAGRRRRTSRTEPQRDDLVAHEAGDGDDGLHDRKRGRTSRRTRIWGVFAGSIYRRSRRAFAQSWVAVGGGVFGRVGVIRPQVRSR